ncbi:MAG: nif-specific transcriptional activator NifA [Nitrospira sp.]|nr:nif-specific transcriptional activator NifA [bacterium]MBL7048617.1 nif-specific transcriptional activator NifA [Nitrospira sp.]
MKKTNLNCGENNTEKNNQTSSVKTPEVQALYRIAQLVGSAAELEVTLSEILKILHDTLFMERASIVLLDEAGENLTIKACYGLTNEERKRGVYNLDEGVIGKVYSSKSPFVVPDIKSEPLFLNRTQARSISKGNIAFIGVPILLRNKPVGVFTVDRLFASEVSYTEDVHFITVVSTLIAQFIELNKVIKQKEDVWLEENRNLRAQLDKRYSRHNIIGQSKVMREVFQLIDRVAPSTATALLLGESGTGKELVAQAIHHSGPRIKAPFIQLNCAAVPETLIESELLGHEKGAFTGATFMKKGRFELANGGTLFLDEIGELPLNLQAKLLRVLQEKNFERLGGTETISVDVRIIAATNINLEEAVAQGLFRADLYYRLNVLPILLPPLRDRVEDIPLLLDFFLRESNERNGKIMQFSRDAVEFLKGYIWPGNVREMQNLVERMVIITDHEICRVSDLPSVMIAEPERPAIQELPHPVNISIKEDSPETPVNSKSSLKDREKEIVEAAMQRNGWVQARAARELGITQRQIGYKIKKYGIIMPEHICIKND